ncbi:hypothetical protein LX87_04589 [Larkinella arboricola]|uniref:Uncharacterized protein n=1 Tax=Larkinella arboricola TaxID=643671 RepID=A0A327WQ93_LARAB|nr:hypothetical protein LX87_04589 [Larkinella arboricola]
MENKPEETRQDAAPNESTQDNEGQKDSGFTGTEDEGNVQGGGSYGSGYGTGSSGSEEGDSSGTAPNRS